MILIKSSILFLLVNLYLFAQSLEPDIKRRLDLINSGRITEVKKELPKLMKNYPENAGVYYLRAVLTEKGDESEKLYAQILKKFPKSEYARKSMYRLYSYYILSGNSTKAEERYSQILKFDPKFKDESVKKTSSYTIQLGAFNSNEKAKAFSDHLKKMKYNTEINSRTVEDKLLYTVNIGKFSSKAEAEKLQKSIEKKLNVASLLVAR